jgi:2,4-dienoyl-CoA reductase-like NADH-dependent reductase (Old Yellow Enzyme family)/thioredoxin reductase
MKTIKSLLGRRQFLIAAGAVSTSALAAGVADPIFQNVAMAAGMSKNVVKTSDVTGTVLTNTKYIYLLSPLKIRNVILKNRMMSTVGCIPHFLQGPETFPSDVIRSYYSNVAKGAAIVTCRLSGGNNSRKNLIGDSAHMMMYDPQDPGVTNYIDQMIEGVHCMGSLVAGANLGGGGPGGGSGKDIVTQAKDLEDQGYDVVNMGVQDWGNKEKVRTTIEQMQAVRNATNLIIMVSMVVMHPSVRAETSDSGQNITSFIAFEDAVATAKMLEGAADMLFLKIACGSNNHPSSFNMEKGKPPILLVSQAIKESGAKILTAPNGGFRDPDLNEEFISSGKTDMVAMARPFICDPGYGKKIYEDKGEDTVPCLMCNKCHGSSPLTGPWITVCSVNPKLGIESAVKALDAPVTPKKVAVIGGGPAGMKAAITAAERGHKVTLYEKNAFLGGLLRHSDFSPYKWALKDFKDYLVRQVKKAGVEVVLNTSATPEMIKAKGYDAVLAATGSEPNIPKIQGADSVKIWNVADVYGKEQELGKNVVFIGGNEFGVETGMYLANAGHKTTMLTSEKELMHNDRLHYPEQVIDAYEHLDNFDYIMGVTANRISKSKITYVDAKGDEKSMPADSVVIYAGLKPRQDEAMKFYGAAKKAFFIAGDCTGKCGNVQKAMRSAFFAASQI